MSKEGEVEVVGERRKSARIMVLEEEKRNERLKRNLSVIAFNNNLSKAGYTVNGSLENEQQLHHGLAPSSRAMPASPPLKRGRKQKRLEDLVLPSFAKNLLQQGGENRQHGNTLTRHDQQVNELPSAPWIPEKRVLELILDILQRRDTHKIFARPVNPKEVDNYYTIIKEPMDFSTMRTKLQEGHYTSLEKFEHDVFLITSNAMHFNSSTTIYYKEARSVQDVAQVIFQCLRTDPQKLESRLISAIRSGGPGKRPLISEIRGRRAKVPRLGGFKIGPSPLGPRDCRKSGTLSERERPLIPFCNDYESLVSPVYDAYTTLVHIDENEKFGYKERLLMFVKNLGPTPQKVAARKLIQCLPNYQAPNLSWQTQISNQQQTTQRFLLPSPTTSSLPLRIPSQSPKIASTVSTLAVISNNVSSHGKNSTFNLNLQASPVDQGTVGSSYGDNKVHEPVDDRRLKIDSLLMPPPKEKSPNDQDVLRKKSFISNNKNAQNGGRTIKAHLNGSVVAKTSDFNGKMGNFPKTFLREKVAGQQNNTGKMSFIFDYSAAKRGGDNKYLQKGKMVVEKSDFNGKMENFHGNYFQENITGQLENNIQVPFMLDNDVASNKERHNKYLLIDKMVAETTNFNEKLETFPGNFVTENVSGQRENTSPMLFLLDSDIAANRGRENQHPLKGKRIAETSDFHKKLGNFPKDFHRGNVAGQRETNGTMSFLFDNNITASRGRDIQYPLKDIMVAETSDHNEKMRNFSGNFLRENVAGQQEISIHMPFMLHNNIASSRGRDDKYCLKEKTVGESSAFNRKKGNFPWESVADRQVSSIQMPFMLDNNIAAKRNKDDSDWLKGKTVGEAGAFSEKVEKISWEGLGDRRENSIPMPFMLDNNIAANGNKDDSDWLKGKTVPEASAFSEEVGNFSWENVADRRENSIQMPFMLDNNIAANGNKDDVDWLKGKTAAEASVCEKVGNFSWENVTDQRENSIQMPFMLDNNSAANGSKDDGDWLKGKTVAEASVCEKVGNFPWESVADQRENSIQMPFMLVNNIAANGNKDDGDWLKGKTVAETSAFSEKVGNFSWENVADRPEKSIQVPFMLDSDIAADGANDNCYGLKGKTVAEISAFNEKVGDFPWENVADQREKSIQVPFMLDNDIAADGAKDNCYGLKGKTVAEISAFNEKVGNFPWENVADQREKSIQVPFMLDNHIAPNRGEDNSYCLKGKTVAEISAFNEKVGNFSWENVADRQDNSTPVPFMLDNIIAASGGKDNNHCLKGKTVAETSSFIEKVRQLSWENAAGQQVNTSQAPFMLDNNIVANRGRNVNYCLNGKTVAETSAFNERNENFPWENVADQRENTSQTPFMYDNNVAANGGNDGSYCLKGKTVEETSAFNEKVANFLCENGDGQQENTSQMPFICNNYIASRGGKDTQHHSLGKMVAETSAFNEKRGNFSKNFLREKVAGQRENSSQMPFILDNNIATNGGRNTKYPLMGKSVAETSDLNDKMEKNSGNFLRENAAGQHENTSQNKCWLASHFRVIPVHDDGDSYTPCGSTKTRFRTVDMLAEGNDIMNHNIRLQKGKQVERVQQASLDRVDQLSTKWESRLNDFVDRSNDLGPTFMSTIPEEMKFLYPSPTSSDTTDLLDPWGQSDGLYGLQDPIMGPNYDGNYTQVLEGGTVSSFPVTYNNEDNSLNQLNYTPMSLRPDLQAPALSSGQLGVLMPLTNEASFILHERVDDDRDPQLQYLNDTDQLPDLDLQL
ncbi:uncharacterized protein LOC133788263 [Humulus lupulus]|uniref:uncharacterized protein LOC133788263 n=1 Tax=Humulus lupulus TaxID=3486 RepID=UPI002B401F5D|nr:uncharacterized protein LOC133788263 [Humulus lupulus]XP_062081660.1 uncharacterized protein LOC133788263 [Humulus lupulus]